MREHLRPALVLLVAFTVITGVVDMSGTMTGFATLAAEGLGIRSEQVSVTSADTASAPRTAR